MASRAEPARLSAFIKRHFRHFNAAALVDAAEGYREHLRNDGRMLLAMAGAMSTAEIGLSVRTTNCLEERGIFTVKDLLLCTCDDLLSISNFGEKTLEEVYKALEGVGFLRKSKREVTVPQSRLTPQPR